jgi:quinol monooxygenase YgiN
MIHYTEKRFGLYSINHKIFFYSRDRKFQSFELFFIGFYQSYPDQLKKEGVNMEHLIVEFKVKKDKIEEAKSTIRDFVSKISQQEPGTVLYNCFQEKGDERSFIHTMSFESEKAEEHHRHTEYVKEFVENLYPVCETEPVFSELNLICSNKTEEFK